MYSRCGVASLYVYTFIQEALFTSFLPSLKIVEWPRVYKGAFNRLKVKSPRGVLLYGPPGCSKTTLVRAVASAAGSSFFSLSGADVFSAYLGDAEKSVRSVNK